MGWDNNFFVIYDLRLIIYDLRWKIGRPAWAARRLAGHVLNGTPRAIFDNVKNGNPIITKYDNV